MRFSFNSESDLEREIIDRCIAGKYIVEVDGELIPGNGRGLTDCVIVERHDGLMALTLHVLDDEDKPTGQKVRVSTDAVEGIHIY